MNLTPATSPGVPHPAAGPLHSGHQAGALGANSLSLCSLTAGNDLFGIDTRTIKEVLGNRVLRKVPLAPSYIGGIVPYRGEVLTTISFRALLGFPPFSGESCVIVLEDDESGDRFGLMVDGVGGVIVVDSNTHSPNPSTIDGRSAFLYDGVFRTGQGLLILLTSRKLRPARLDSELSLTSSGPIKYSLDEEAYADRPTKSTGKPDGLHMPPSGSNAPRR